MLIEAKQKVPPFLMQLDEISADLLELGGKEGRGEVRRGDYSVLILQTRKVAHIVVVWAIASRSVPNWKPSR